MNETPFESQSLEDKSSVIITSGHEQELLCLTYNALHSTPPTHQQQQYSNYLSLWSYGSDQFGQLPSQGSKCDDHNLQRPTHPTDGDRMLVVLSAVRGPLTLHATWTVIILL